MFRQTLNEIGSNAERIINSGQNYATVISTISSLTVRSFALGTMAYDFLVVFDVLNERLKEEIERLQTFDRDTLNDVTREQSQEFKNSVFNTIERDLMKRLKIVINEQFVAPILKFVISKGVDKASTAFDDLMTGIRSNDEKSKNVARNLNLQNDENASGLATDQENNRNDASKMEEIKANTSVPELISQYAMYATPLLALCGTDMEAISRRVQRAIEVNYEGIRYVFGKSSDVYKLHTGSSTDRFRQLSIDSVYQQLKDEIKTDLPKFQRDVAKIIKNDLIEISYLNNQLKQFGTLGFYAGKIIINIFIDLTRN